LRDVGGRREYDTIWPSIFRSPTAQLAAADRKAAESRRRQDRERRKAEAEVWEKRRREEELRKAEAEQEERRRKIEESRKAEALRERKRREAEADEEEIRQFQERVRKEEAEREGKRRKAEDASRAEADSCSTQHPVTPAVSTHERPTLSITTLWKLSDQKNHLARDVFETNRVIRRLRNEIERISTQIVETDAELKTHDSNANSWSSYVFSALHGEQQKIQNDAARDLIVRRRLDLINAKVIKESSLEGKKNTVAEWESNIRDIEEAITASHNDPERPQDAAEHQKRERLRERMEEQQRLKSLRAEEGEQLKRERLRERMEKQQNLKTLRAEEEEQLRQDQAREAADAQLERERVRKEEEEDQQRKQEEIQRCIAEQQRQEQLWQEVDDWANVFADMEQQAEVQRQRELNKVLEEEWRAQETEAKKAQDHRRKFDEYLARCNILRR
jgi:hypothetical protein